MFEQDIEKKTRELEIQMSDLDREMEELYKELKVTPEQISTYLSEKENFTDNNWMQLQDLKETLDKKLQANIHSIKDTRKTKKAYSERNINHHWLFVR